MQMDEKVKKTIIDIVRIINKEKARTLAEKQNLLANPATTTLKDFYKIDAAKHEAWEIYGLIGDYIEELGFSEEVRLAIMSEAAE